MRQKRRVLLVESDAPTLKSIRDVLQREFEVMNSSSSEDALDLLENQDTDCIIVDLRMPGMSGIDFVKEVREWNGGVAVILVGKEVDELEWLEAINAGANALISKPFTKDKIVKAVHKAIKENGFYPSNGTTDQPAF